MTVPIATKVPTQFLGDMTTIQKDILTIEHGWILHQVNCQGVMGAGLAKKIADKWPVVLKQYRARCLASNEHPVLMLGQYEHVRVTKTLSVINIFGQLDYGGRQRHTDYGALVSAARKLSQTDNVSDQPIYIPYGMGCGLGGGD